MTRILQDMSLEEQDDFWNDIEEENKRIDYESKNKRRKS